MCALTLAPIELTLALIKPTVYASQSHVQEIMHIIKAHHFEASNSVLLSGVGFTQTHLF